MMLWTDERIDSESKQALFDADGNPRVRGWEVEGLMRQILYRMRDDYEERIANAYLLFAGDRYYPEGGWSDYRGRFDTREAAIEWAIANIENGDEHHVTWWHIVDLAAAEIIESNYGEYNSSEQRVVWSKTFSDAPERKVIRETHPPHP